MRMVMGSPLSGSSVMRREDTVSATVGYTRVQPVEPAPISARVFWSPVEGGPKAGSKPAARQAVTTVSKSTGFSPREAMRRRQFGKVGEVQMVTVGQRVRGGQRDHQRVVPEGEEAQAGGAFDAPDEGRVQPTGAYLLQAGVGVEGLELEAGAGAAVGQRVQEVVQALPQRGADADAEGGRALCDEPLGFGGEGVQRLQQCAALGQQGLADRE